MALPAPTLLAALILGCMFATLHCRTFNSETSSLSVDSSRSEKVVADISETTNTTEVQDHDLHFSFNSSSSRYSSRRNLRRYESSNPIDECWRGDSNWADDRMRLADCVIGFGINAVGGKHGKIYVVTDSGDDAVNPAPGTLRYGVIQLDPLWIIFERDMTITLENELIMTGDKTLDGRGADVHIAYGPCITIQDVSNVIVHGLSIHDCKPGKPGIVVSSTVHVGYREGADGDGISLFGAQDVWIDHNYLANCYDGLLDVIHGSTGVTISNNVFRDHDKVMLLGHSDDYEEDKVMEVTVAYNRFGPGCVQRMPRCRWGYFHVVNNDYASWEMYAIGGSANPTIISEGNRYQAPNNPNAKEVTKRDCYCNAASWSDWNWNSVNDVFLNGAFFVESRKGSVDTVYGNRIAPRNSGGQIFNSAMTASAGPLSCSQGSFC